MIVTKQGNVEKLKGYVKFRCPDCGCEFIADNTEYQYECNQHDGESYEITCPCCNERNYLWGQNVIKKYDDMPDELKEKQEDKKILYIKAVDHSGKEYVIDGLLDIQIDRSPLFNIYGGQEQEQIQITARRYADRIVK